MFLPGTSTALDLNKSSTMKYFFLRKVHERLAKLVDAKVYRRLYISLVNHRYTGICIYQAAKNSKPQGRFSNSPQASNAKMKIFTFRRGWSEILRFQLRQSHSNIFPESDAWRLYFSRRVINFLSVLLIFIVLFPASIFLNYYFAWDTGDYARKAFVFTVPYFWGEWPYSLNGFGRLQEALFPITAWGGLLTNAVITSPHSFARAGKVFALF